MKYLNEKVANYLDSVIKLTEKESNSRTKLINSTNENEIIYLSIENQSKDNQVIKIGIDNAFYFLLVKDRNGYIAYAYKDIENLNDIEFSIYSPAGLLTKSVKNIFYNKVITLYLTSIVGTIIEENLENSLTVLECKSFKKIRVLFLVFILKSSIVSSWGTHNIVLIKNGLKFNVKDVHFDGIIQIIYNISRSQFNVMFLDNHNVIIGGRYGIYIDELIQYIDTKVVYTPAN